jgi:hypothetical protein
LLWNFDSFYNDLLGVLPVHRAEFSDEVSAGGTDREEDSPDASGTARNRNGG